MLVNQGNLIHAAHAFDDARTAAHEAGNLPLVSYTLGTMSLLAMKEGRTHIGIDDAAAAASWADQCASPQAQLAAADMMARSHIEAGQAHPAEVALGRARDALDRIDPSVPTESWWYFCDEAFYWGTRSHFEARLGTPNDAVTTAQRCLDLTDPGHVHDRCFITLFKAEAVLRQRDVDEAARLVGDTAELASVNSARRIDTRITDLRRALDPWADTPAVRSLDDRLTARRHATVA